MSFWDKTGGVLDSMTSFSNSIANIGNSIGGVVNQVNEFELPAVRTKSQFGFDSGTMIFLAVLTFLGIKMLRK